MTVIEIPLEPDPRMKIKRAARRLFAEHGFRGVTVREIAKAAGQKNHGAVGYYFGSKENLIREIIIDGARLIEGRRNDLLDRIEATGGPTSVYQAVQAIVLPSAEFSDEEPENGDYFNRFLLLLSLANDELITKTLDGRWNTGYQRCLYHLRRLMPDMPSVAKNRRFVFIGTYVSSLLALREMMLTDKTHAHPSWRSEAMLNDILQTTTAILEAPLNNQAPSIPDATPRRRSFPLTD